jgi:hypothetical protein
MTQIWRSFFALARVVFAREELPQAEPKGPSRRARRSLVSLLFAPEPLPLDPPRPGRRSTSALRWLLTPEELGPAPLPADPSPPRPRRSGWLRWLFSPEHIDGQ